MEELNKLIKNSEVLILSKTICKYCDIAKNELKPYKYKVTVIDVLEDPNGPLLFEAAKELTGQRTVPNIWINSQHIGGSDKLREKLCKDNRDKMTDILKSDDF